MSRPSYNFELITPEIAADVLANHNHCNRPIRIQWARELASRILRGEWHPHSHQGVSFNCDGTLHDGQHRLKAIVIAGQAVWLWVLRNQPRDAVPFLDDGIPRRPHDVAHFMGETWINKNVISISRRMQMGPTDAIWVTARKANNVDVLHAMKHKEAIQFARGQLASGYFAVAPIVAVIARAWYTADRERLARFCHVLKEGAYAESRDSAAVALARWFLANRLRLASKIGSLETYRKTEAALVAFLEERPISSLKGTTIEHFPIPGSISEGD